MCQNKWKCTTNALKNCKLKNEAYTEQTMDLTVGPNNKKISAFLHTFHSITLSGVCAWNFI